MEENLSRKTIVRFVQSLNLVVLFIVNTGILSPKWKLYSTLLEVAFFQGSLSQWR